MGLLASFSEFLEDSFGVLRRFSARLEVVEQNEQRCVIQGDRRRVVLNLERRIADVGSAGRLPFAQFGSVEVEHFHHEDRGTFWRVSLITRLRGRLEVGSSTIDIDASIAAATLARHLGCPVKSF